MRRTSRAARPAPRRSSASRQDEKYNASKVDERHRDHALYTAFAPLDEPRIALAMVVENAGFGAGAAAPIARRVFDYVLHGLYPSEADIAATQQGKSTAPIGTPRADRRACRCPAATIDGASRRALAPVPPVTRRGRSRRRRRAAVRPRADARCASAR